MKRLLIALSLLVFASGLARGADIPDADKRSGYAFMSRDTQAMQDDDTANPGMLGVLEGEQLWGRSDGGGNRSCASCHGEATASMKGVAARYPAFDPTLRRVIDLDQRINLCRTERQNATALPYDGAEMLALSAYVAHQSRGSPIELGSSEPLREAIETGRVLFERRHGQLNLSCAQCHDQNWGKRLGGSTIPQGHATGYPVYRLEWQKLGSLRRRLRGCMTGVRAEPFAEDSPELVALEAYLMWRGRGLPIETPAVRP